MTTQLCAFRGGTCIHCGDTQQGLCEGWNEPDKSAREIALEADLDAEKLFSLQTVKAVDEIAVQRDALEAENARLREALETIAGTTDGTDCNEVATEALKETT